jgi:hypothetical protein
VFIESLRDTKPMRGYRMVGGSSAFSTMVNGFQVTVVGEVPEPTARMIGDSMRPLAPRRREMIRHIGTVVSADGDHAWVECTAWRSLCRSVRAVVPAKSSPWRTTPRIACGPRTGAACEPGADVVVGSPAGALLRAACFAYALPLAALLGGAALGAIAGPRRSRRRGGARARPRHRSRDRLAAATGRPVPVILEPHDS